MSRTRESKAAYRNRSGGFTLVEMVVVIALLGIIGLVPSYVIVESMRVYARTAPKVDAAYQARLADDRMKREIRDLKGLGRVTAMTSSAFTFDDSSDTTIAYSLSASNLLRNGDLMAKGVTSLTFSYWKSDGTVASAAADLNLVEYDLTVQTGSEPYRVQAAVFPRLLSTLLVPTGPLDIDASVGTIATPNSRRFSLDLVSLSAVGTEIEKFELSASRAMPDLEEFELATARIWEEPLGISLPTGEVTLNNGTASERTVSAATSPSALFEFASDPTGGVVNYTLVIHFTDGSSSTLTFSVTW